MRKKSKRRNWFTRGKRAGLGDTGDACDNFSPNFRTRIYFACLTILWYSLK